MRAARRDGAALRVLAACAPDRGAARLGRRAVQRDRHCTLRAITGCPRAANSPFPVLCPHAHLHPSQLPDSNPLAQSVSSSCRVSDSRPIDSQILRYFIYIRSIIVCTLPQREGSISDVDGALLLLMLIASPSDANSGLLQQSPPPLPLLPHHTEVFLSRRHQTSPPIHNIICAHSHPISPVAQSTG